MDLSKDNSEETEQQVPTTNYVLPLFSLLVYWLFGLQFTMTTIFGYMAVAYGGSLIWAKFVFMLNMYLFGFWKTFFGLCSYALYTAIYNREQVKVHLNRFREFVKTIEMGEDLRKQMNVEVDEEDKKMEYYVHVFLVTWNSFCNIYTTLISRYHKIVHFFAGLNQKYNLSTHFWSLNSLIGQLINLIRMNLEKIPYLGRYFRKVFSAIQTQIKFLTDVPVENKQEVYSNLDTLEALLKPGISMSFPDQLNSPFGAMGQFGPMGMPTENDLKSIQKLMEDMKDFQAMLDNFEPNSFPQSLPERNQPKNHQRRAKRRF